MTDLDKAIAELRQMTTEPWFASNELTTDMERGPASKAIATILNAVLSGALIPAVERDAAVAAALERARGEIRAARLGERTEVGAAYDYGLEDAVDKVADLITRPQSDALAAVRVEARREERERCLAALEEHFPGRLYASNRTKVHAALAEGTA